MTEDQGLTVGRYLRQEREKKGVSLDSVAQATRITREALEALERDDFEAISAPVFVRGFLRNYANCLGLDPKELVARYDSQTDLLKAPRVKEASIPPKDQNPVFKYLMFLCILLAGAAVAFYYFQESSPPPAPLPPSVAIAPAPNPLKPSPAPVLQPPPPKAVTPAEKPVPKVLQPEKEKKPSEKPPAAPAAPPDKEASMERRHVLKVVAGEKTWMRILADGQQTFDVLLQPKETATWTARRQFEITVGNAGGVELSLNGVPQGPLGKPGEVIHLTLPKGTQGTPAPKPVPAKEFPPPNVSQPAPPQSIPASIKDALLQKPKPSTPAPLKENLPSQEPASKETKPSRNPGAEETTAPEIDKEAIKSLR